MTITTAYDIGDQVWTIEMRYVNKTCGECGQQTETIGRNEITGPHTIESIQASVGRDRTVIIYALGDLRHREDRIYPTRQIALVALEDLT